MKEAGDLVALSVPFTLGIGAGAFITRFIGYNQEYIAAGAAIAICAILLGRLISGRDGRIPFPILFLALGLFCAISSDLLPASSRSGGVFTLASSCSSRLRGLIASVPFSRESTNALISALLTGDRSGLNSDLTSVFRDSGASHILALSGLHLGVIYVIFTKLLSIAGNSVLAVRMRSIVIILFSGFYTLMTGAGPSIVRAFLFILINEAGGSAPERKRSPVRTLLAALTIQLALKPSVLSTLGFQLSYLAMTGIILLYPKLSSWYPDDASLNIFSPARKIWNSTALTISCQVFTAPLVWIKFHTFPKYFIITNLIALPMTSVIMAVSVGTLFLYGTGWCPALLLKADELLVQNLLFSLECISGM